MSGVADNDEDGRRDSFTGAADARGESKEDKILAASRKRRSGRGSSSILTGFLGVTVTPNNLRRPSLLGS